MITDNSHRRQQLTRLILDLTGEKTSKGAVKAATSLWWRTPWPYGGFCLTQPGADAFERAGIECSTHPITENDDAHISAGFLVRLSVLMPCPYYIIENPRRLNTASKIKIYDDRISTLVYLYGDVDKYLLSLENE